MRKLLDIRGSNFAYSKRGKLEKLICLDPVLLDIETSNNHAEKTEDLITWISSIQVYFRGCYFLLRTPEELMQFYLTLYEEYDLMQAPPHRDRIIYTFIHNSSYDLSYLIPYFREYLPAVQGEPQGLIDGNNKILTYTQGCLEFRCTHRLTGKSLAQWTKDLQVEHVKQVGLYDYDKIIFQDDELSEDEQAYDKNDVVGLYEALTKQNSLRKDTLATMPLTLTGYVRRDLRRCCLRSRYFRENYFLKSKLDHELFYAFLKSFSGGYTHNNRYYKNITVRVGDTVKFWDQEIKVNRIKHRDFKSHYPTQQTCYLMPIGSPQMIYDNSNDIRDTFSIDEILAYYPKFFTMSIIRFSEAKLSDNKISMPFMQFSKMQECEFERIVQDNGRVIFARGAWIMFLDNLTLQILNEQYDLQYEVIKVWKLKAGYMPSEIVSCIDNYFKGKSDQKNLVKELEDKYGKLDYRTFEANFHLMTNKSMLNSIYGCSATSPLRLSYEINDNMEYRIKEFFSTKEEIQTGLDKFYSNRNNFLPYQYGCITTASARFELYQYIKAIGYDKVLYCDTDSIFYIADDDTEKAVDDLNKEKRKTAHSVLLNNGKEEFYDEFTEEPELIAFRGLHSKCYGVVTKETPDVPSHLEITIAGVPPKSYICRDHENKPLYYTREQELSGMDKGVMLPPIMALEKLTDDFTFTVNTGISAVYIGAVGGIDGIRKPMKLEVDGHIVSTAGGCVLRKLKEKKVHDIGYDFSYELADLSAFGY